MKEIQLSASAYSSLPPLETIYFGGGTPSLLPIPQLKSILEAIRSHIGIHESCETTIEIDPGTFNEDKLNQWLELGFNRFSLGVQSFDALILQKCGRAHTVDDAYKALEVIHNAKDPINFSLDLISGLPYLTLELWETTLREALTSGASHISIYDLQIEEKTAFGRWYRDSVGQFPLPEEQTAVDMYRLASSLLTNSGFEHYEISNYAKPGKRSRHNQLYWSCAPTFGFGMSAASYTDNIRFSRPRKLEEYTQWVNSLSSRGYAELIHESYEPSMSVSEKVMDKLQDTIMLSLRTSTGLNLTDIRHSYGVEALTTIEDAVREYEVQGLVESHTDLAGCSSLLRLTDPEGFLVSNDIISSIFAALLDD